ncbi:hypothetical protein QJS10_CPB12g00293 [Acorus calamus]|uniref:Uncharacterized protein n=1 Tax=Acorus calamus TaxID=4465 RepID=A0AAV9DKQ2_ACOCL|nr:hypothetical protein QJS10_CPB12g00293 [Acorus calamus]
MASMKLIASSSSQWFGGRRTHHFDQRAGSTRPLARRVTPIRAGSYTEELVQTAVSGSSPDPTVLTLLSVFLLLFDWISR